MPRPLSSHTNSSGSGRPLVRRQAGGVDRARGGGVVGRGVAEGAHGDRVVGPGDRRRSSLRAPSDGERHAERRAAGGEAIVDVCGITARSWWPNTLCRPPAIGSSAAASRPSSTSRTPVVTPAACAGAGAGRTRPSGSGAAPGRSGRSAAATRGVALVAGRADRVVAAPDGAQPAGGVVEQAALDLGGEQRREALDLRPGGGVGRGRSHLVKAIAERLQRSEQGRVERGRGRRVGGRHAPMMSPPVADRRLNERTPARSKVTGSWRTSLRPKRSAHACDGRRPPYRHHLRPHRRRRDRHPLADHGWSIRFARRCDRR